VRIQNQCAVGLVDDVPLMLCGRPSVAIVGRMLYPFEGQTKSAVSTVFADMLAWFGRRSAETGLEVLNWVECSLHVGLTDAI